MDPSKTSKWKSSRNVGKLYEEQLRHIEGTALVASTSTCSTPAASHREREQYRDTVIAIQPVVSGTDSNPDTEHTGTNSDSDSENLCTFHEEEGDPESTAIAFFFFYHAQRPLSI